MTTQPKVKITEILYLLDDRIEALETRAAACGLLENQRSAMNRAAELRLFKNTILNLAEEIQNAREGKD